MSFINSTLSVMFFHFTSCQNKIGVGCSFWYSGYRSLLFIAFSFYHWLPSVTLVQILLPSSNWFFNVGKYLLVFKSQRFLKKGKTKKSKELQLAWWHWKSWCLMVDTHKYKNIKFTKNGKIQNYNTTKTKIPNTSCYKIRTDPKW